MIKLETLSTALAITAAGCGGSVEGAPKEMGLVMDGYAVSCNEIKTGNKPFQVDHYCGNGEEMAYIEPSVYVEHSGKFRDAFNCVFKGLLIFEIKKTQQAPQMDTSFIGGISQKQGLSGKAGVALSFPDGHFYTYVVDSRSQEKPYESCQVMVASLHETGHGLLNMALPQRDFSRYGLDEHGHDSEGSETIMQPSSICFSSLKFSEATARAIEENLHPDNPRPERLQNIAERCVAEIKEVTDLPIPPPGE